MEIGSAFVSHSESLELVQPGEGTLDHPTHLAQTGAVRDTAAGDDRLTAANTMRWIAPGCRVRGGS